MFLFHLHTDVPSACLLADGRTEDLDAPCRNIALLFQFHPANPGKLHVPIKDMYRAIEAEGPTPFVLTLELRKAALALVFALLFQSDFSEEVLIGSIQVPQRILHHPLGDFAQPGKISMLAGGEFPLQIVGIRRWLPILVGFLLAGQAIIVGVTSCTRALAE